MQQYHDCFVGRGQWLEFVRYEGILRGTPSQRAEDSATGTQSMARDDQILGKGCLHAVFLMSECGSWC